MVAEFLASLVYGRICSPTVMEIGAGFVGAPRVARAGGGRRRQDV